MTAAQLRHLYEVLKGEDCASLQTLARLTGFTRSQIRTGINLLMARGLVKNSASCIAEEQFSAK